MPRYWRTNVLDEQEDVKVIGEAFGRLVEVRNMLHEDGRLSNSRMITGEAHDVVYDIVPKLDEVMQLISVYLKDHGEE